MAGCLVFKTCKLHRTAAQWLADGRLDQLQGHLDLLVAIAPRAWAHCTCGLWGRIEAAIGPLPTPSVPPSPPDAG